MSHQPGELQLLAEIFHALGDVHELLGVADEHLLLLGVEQPTLAEVGHRVRQRLARGADNLGQLLLGQARLDERAA